LTFADFMTCYWCSTWFCYNQSLDCLSWKIFCPCWRSKLIISYHIKLESWKKCKVTWIVKMVEVENAALIERLEQSNLKVNYHTTIWLISLSLLFIYMLWMLQVVQLEADNTQLLGVTLNMVHVSSRALLDNTLSNIPRHCNDSTGLYTSNKHMKLYL